MDLSGLTDDELLSRRHQAFLRLSSGRGFDVRRTDAYEEIGLINRELRRRPGNARRPKHRAPSGAVQKSPRDS